MQTAKGFIGLLLISLLTVSASHAQRLTPVDLELAFVVDASGSIDEEEMALQRQATPAHSPIRGS